VTMPGLSDLFSLVCAQFVPHTWAPGGWWLPCCQRCSGLYAGAATATALRLLLRVRDTRSGLLVHALFVILMVPLGFQVIPQDAVARSASGVLYGVALVAFAWQAMPGVTRATRDGRPVHQATTRERPARAAALLYWAGVLLVTAAVPTAGEKGGRGAWYALAAASVGGLGALATLTGVSLAHGGARLVRASLHGRFLLRFAPPRRPV
jgi:uncharacterized membrane protein